MAEKPIPLNLYLISQTENNNYDTYDSAVVAATTAEEAKTMHPNGSHTVTEEDIEYFSNWCKLSNVQVVHIGTALTGTTKAVICASFRAG